MRGKASIKQKEAAIALRKEGKTYTEIQETIRPFIPQSTLSTWFRTLSFSAEEKGLIAARAKGRIKIGYIKTLQIKKLKRQAYFENLRSQLSFLVDLLDYRHMAKIALAMLYWGEGGKNRDGVFFGNSDPHMVALFLDLLRRIYDINETKFRCTIQCRADQNIPELEQYWSAITKIPPGQFYKTRIDKRTIGKPSKKLDYKGVCCIDYFSASIYHELITIISLFQKGR